MDLPTPEVPAASRVGSRPTRRRFLQQASWLLAAPLLLPRRARAKAAAPGERLTLGCIGIGKQMREHLGTLLQRDDVQVLAVCDVDTTRREHGKKKVETTYAEQAGGSYRACDAYNDFREVLARGDIDAVLIATPDHWHAAIAIAAVESGKDVYCEKPLTYNVHEALALMQAVRQTDRILQTGSQQRSAREFRVAAELVRNGALGRIRAVEVGFGGPPSTYDKRGEDLEPGLDWNRWCGPGPLVPYHPMLSPRGIHDHYPRWRDTWEFGGGMITDWGAHHIDIAHWALDMDSSGPIAVHAPDNWEKAERGARLTYAREIELTHVKGGKGVSFFGSDGELHVDRGQFEFIRHGKTVHKFWNKLVDRSTSMEREVELTAREFLADAPVKLYVSKDHFQNFVDCVRDRRRPICDVEVGARSVIACHVMNFAYHYGANASWDPVTNTFVTGGRPEWLTREQYRQDWAA